MVEDIVLLGFIPFDLNGEERFSKVIEWYEPDIISLEMPKKVYKNIDMLIAENRNHAIKMRKKYFLSRNVSWLNKNISVNKRTASLILENKYVIPKVANVYASSFGIDIKCLASPSLKSISEKDLENIQAGKYFDYLAFPKKKFQKVIDKLYGVSPLFNNNQIKFYEDQNKFTQNELRNMSGKVLHVSTVDNVVDTKGKYANLRDYLIDLNPKVIMLNEADGF